MTKPHGGNPTYAAFFSTATLAGALTFVAFWLLCLVLSSGFSVMGVQAGTVTKVVFQQFLPSVIWVQLRILAAYMVIGALAGLAGAIIVTGLSARLSIVRSRKWAVAAGAGFGIVIELLFLIWAIRRTPQLYADIFYLPGGWTRQVMVIITDHLPRWIVPFALLGIALIAAVALVLTIRRIASEHLRWRGWSWSGITVALLMTMMAGTALIGSARSGGRVAPESHRTALAAEKAPGIIILAADSFRLDHIGGYGYHRPTSPVIDSLMSRGTVFRSAITPLPRTFPAWVSYLTGTYPCTHGVLNMFPTDADRQHLPPAVPEILGRSGWHSGVISDFAGDVFSGVELGFKTVRAPEFNFVTLIKLRSLEIHWALLPYVNSGWGRRLFPVLTEFAQAAYPEYPGHEARTYLKQLARRNQPFFLTVFFSATHFPYSAPEPYYHLFTDPDYQGDYKYHKPNLLKPHEELTKEDIDQILALYDGAVKAIDVEIGKTLRTLEDTGLSASTWIIVTADHGENLYEDETGMGHGEHLRGGNVLDVPLIIVPPRSQTNGRWKIPDNAQHPRWVDLPVSGVDLAPTVLDIAGVPADTAMEGWSLLPLMRQRKVGTPDTTLDHGDRVLKAFRDRPVFAETGLWFADWTEGFYQHQRIQYPDISKLCRLDRFHHNQIVLKDNVRDLTEVAKHRAVVLDDLKLIRIPTRLGIMEEGYRVASDGSELPADTNDPDFQVLRDALMAHLTADQRFEKMGDYVIPEGWEWRLNWRRAGEE